MPSGGRAYDRDERPEVGVGYALGVDIGTTFTAAAVAHGDTARTIGLGNRANAVPSLVYVRPDGGLLIGDAARHRWESDPDGIAREFKRRFGDPTPLYVRGQGWPAEVLTGHLLRWVVDRVAEQEGGPPDDVVLTCPATWGDYRRAALHEAARLAGLDEVSVLTEPEAAAVHYAQREHVPSGAYVAVYDLGGGTFDASVVRATAAGPQLHGRPEGVEHLGGVDFDEVVFGLVADALGDRLATVEPDDPAAVRGLIQLRAACVAAKEDLSTQRDTVVPVNLPGLDEAVPLRRDQFERAVRPLVDETITTLRRALDHAGVATDDLHTTLLVGGSSRMPLVAELVAAATGRPLAIDAHPKEAIALGAAASRHVARTVAPKPPDTVVPEGSSPSDAADVLDGPEDVESGGSTAPPLAIGGRRAPPAWTRNRGVLLAGAALAAVVIGIAVGLSTLGGNGSSVDDAGRGDVDAGPTGPVVPSVIGVAREEAAQRLEAAGLLLDVAGVNEVNQPVGQVTHQDPSAGEPPPEDRVVVVDLSGGPQPRPVPDVLFRPVDEAADALIRAGFDPRVELKAGRGGTGAVIDTLPRPGGPATPGDEVVLHVASDATEVPVPDVTGSTYQQARERLERLGLTVDLVGIPRSDLAPGLVAASTPAAGRPAPPGGAVRLDVAVRTPE